MAGGRPLKFETVEKLQAEIDCHFGDTKEEKLTIVRNVGKRPTTTLSDLQKLVSMVSEIHAKQVRD